MKKWTIAVPIVLIVLFVAWYIFRPERLYVNRPVDEAMPTAQAASADSPAAGQRNREHGDPDGKGADKRKTRENRRGDCLW